MEHTLFLAYRKIQGSLFFEVEPADTFLLRTVVVTGWKLFDNTYIPFGVRSIFVANYIYHEKDNLLTTHSRFVIYPAVILDTGVHKIS